jgi:hypothetical protein
LLQGNDLQHFLYHLRIVSEHIHAALTIPMHLGRG